jgi:hypothetical protein
LVWGYSFSYYCDISQSARCEEQIQLEN